MPILPPCLVVDRSDAFRWSTLRLLVAAGAPFVAVAHDAAAARAALPAGPPALAIVEWRAGDADLRGLIADFRASQPPVTVVATLDADRRMHPEPAQLGVDVIADKARLYETLLPLLEAWSSP